MNNVSKSFKGLSLCVLRHIDSFGFVFAVASVILAVLSPFYAGPRACLPFTWALSLLGISCFLTRLSICLKSKRGLFLSFIDILSVVFVAVDLLFDIKAFPLLSGWGLGIILFIFFAVNAIVFKGSVKGNLSSIQRYALIILCCGVVLCAALTGVSPQWIDLLVLNAVSIIAILSFRKKTARGLNGGTGADFIE